MENEETINYIKKLIDPSSQDYSDEKHPYLIGRGCSSWATEDQLETAVKSLGYNIISGDLKSILMMCSYNMNLKSYSIEQFAKFFNSKFNKQQE